MATKGFEVEVTGIKEILKDLGVFGQQAIKVTAAALYQEAEIVMGQAKELTPVDTGTLRASGHVRQPEENAGIVSVEMGFGGAAESYALKVHEDLTVFHKVGQAKFLEIPALAAEPKLEGNVAARITNLVERYGRL